MHSTLESLVRLLSGVLGARLVSVVLYGSAVFDDLAPGYGDLDFLVVVEGDLSEKDCTSLIELRRPLRAESAGVLQRMLEGAFLPRRMLDPAVTGRAVWWGTNGERLWEANKLGPLVLHVIRERGRTIFGQDIRSEIPAVGRADMLRDVRDFCLSARAHGRGGTLHSIDWLLTAARMLLWVLDGRLSSKSEAAQWGQVHAAGAWRELLPKAAFLRRSPGEAAKPEWQAWLASLGQSIRQAIEELEIAIAGEEGHEVSSLDSRVSMLSCPQETLEGLLAFRDSMSAFLGDRLVGLYLYGSLANGCYNGKTSDVDLLAVLAKPIDADVKAAMLELHRQATIPVDGTYITVDELNDNLFPTPLQCVIRPAKLFTVPDGLIDFLVVRQDAYASGVRLLGPETQSMIRPVPWELLRQCVLQLFPVALERFKNPVLMLCRIICTLSTRQPCSKVQAAQWALANIESEWHGMISQALQDYDRGLIAGHLPPEHASAFEAYCRRRAERAAPKS